MNYDCGKISFTLSISSHDFAFGFSKKSLILLMEMYSL